MTVKELMKKLENVEDKEMEVKLEFVDEDVELKGVIEISDNYIQLTSWTKTY